MLTIREIKERTEAFLEAKGVPDTRLDTDMLIAHTLGMKRLDVYLDIDRPLVESQLAALRALVKRRANREPLQYIIGSVEFYGIQLKLDSRALIPRHETEELVTHVVDRLSKAPGRILDLGTGSGALALAFATEYPKAEVDAVDLSSAALSLAKENAEVLGLDEHITFHEGSWWTPLDSSKDRYDLIVSNPPYLTQAEMASAEPEVVNYEPKEALASGVDGLDAIREIFSEAGDFLNKDGVLAFETGINQQTELDALSDRFGLHGESANDLSGRPRFYFVQKK